MRGHSPIMRRSDVSKSLKVAFVLALCLAASRAARRLRPAGPAAGAGRGERQRPARPQEHSAGRRTRARRLPQGRSVRAAPERAVHRGVHRQQGPHPHLLQRLPRRGPGADRASASRPLEQRAGPSVERRDGLPRPPGRPAGTEARAGPARARGRGRGLDRDVGLLRRRPHVGRRPRARQSRGRLPRLAGVAGVRPAGGERPRRRLCPVRQVLPGLAGVHSRGGEPSPRLAVHRRQRQRPAPHHPLRRDDRRRSRAERGQRPLPRQARRRHRADRRQRLRRLRRPRELHHLRRPGRQQVHEQGHRRVVHQRRPDLHPGQGRRQLYPEPGHRPGGPPDQPSAPRLLALVQPQHDRHEQEDVERELVEAGRPPGRPDRDGALRPADAGRPDLRLPLERLPGGRDHARRQLHPRRLAGAL